AVRVPEPPGPWHRAGPQSKESPMPSFDVVCQADTVELRNAVDQSNKEIANRFDFKGSDARIELGENLLTIYADDDFKASQVRDILLSKCAKRKLDVRFL